MKGFNRWWLAALAVVAGLAIWSSRMAPPDADLLVAEGDRGQVPATSPAPATGAAQPSSPSVAPAGTTTTINHEDWQTAMRREEVADAAGDPFHSNSKPAPPTITPAPVPSTANLPSPVPPPPPPPASLPYKYMGKLLRGEKLDIYLDFNGSPIVGHVGDNLPGGWRLDSLNAGILTFTNLASGEKQVLSLGAP